MVSLETFRQLALSLEQATEETHFQKTSFRIKKKIFATLDSEAQKALLKLSEIDQSVFCAFDKAVIYPVSGSWGKQSWTIVELSKIKKTMLLDALKAAYRNVAPKRPSKRHSVD